MHVKVYGDFSLRLDSSFGTLLEFHQIMCASNM